MTDSNSPLQYQPTPVGNAKAYEEILRTSIIHIGEEYQSPPEIIWVDDSVIATLGNFSASTESNPVKVLTPHKEIKGEPEVLNRGRKPPEIFSRKPFQKSDNLSNPFSTG